VLELVRKSKFPLGAVMVTAEARELLSDAEIRRAIARHSQGDWGDVDDETRAENNGGIGYIRLSICSRYPAQKGGSFWVMTMPERQQTIVMLGTLEESSAYS
jgi:hypothetical protein